jgi:hypothetical protein
MRERAVILGGRLQLARGEGGRGARVRVRVPLEALGQAAKLSATSESASPRRAMP